MENLSTTMPAAAISGEAGLLLLTASVSLLWQASGLLRSKQGYLLPVACGLTGLAGFLVNPIADSSSLIDLRAQLMQRETLLTLCAVQMLLAGTAIVLNLWTIARPDRQRWELALGVFHCLPAPMVVLSMLLVEQQWLAAQVGARPEWIGIWVALSAVLVLGLLSGICWVLGAHRQLHLHLVSSVLLGLVAGLGTALDRPLPATDLAQTAAESTWALLGVLIVAVVLLAGGVAVERLAQRRRVLSTAEPKRTS